MSAEIAVPDNQHLVNGKQGAQRVRMIGLMSGTSVDGIDAACIEISGVPGAFELALTHFETVTWDCSLRDAILQNMHPDAGLQTITALNVLVGEAMANAAISAARNASWPLDSIFGIGSHGQTMWHQPLPHPFPIGCKQVCGTFQVGDGSIIAVRTGCKVVSDFRTADMAVGGQGAPLVPFADYALFADQRESRAVQNIGGIANVTFLLPGKEIKDIVAFDTGPGNVVMDLLCQSRRGIPYDAYGSIAAKGRVSDALYSTMMDSEQWFFNLKPPKSTGRERFGRIFAEKMLADGSANDLSFEDILCTALEITVQSIQESYQKFLQPLSPVDKVIIGGGGARNRYLMKRLQRALKPAEVGTHEAYGINSDAKEAIAFALLAYETLHGRPSNVPSATGAKAPAILGKISSPYNPK